MDSFEYVLAVAEERNITKAAAKMFITQPALTLRLNRLEKELGIRIFDRTQSPIAITREGAYYIAEMKKIRASEEQLRNTLSEMSQKTDSHLTFGIGLNKGRIWLPRLLPQLQKLDPLMTLQVYEASDGAMEQLLKDGTIDAGIMTSAILSQELTSIPLGTETLFFAVPAEHPILHGYDISKNSPEHPCIISPEQLNQQTFIFSHQPYGVTKFCQLIFSLYHITPGHVLNIANSETAYWLSGAGMGITIAFEQYHRALPQAPDERRPVLCSISNHPMERKVFLACKMSNQNNPRILFLAEQIRKFLYL